jgi:hypothetical protein
MSQAALKSNGKMYGLVRKIDRNTRAVAKLASAIDYLETDGRDLGDLQLALYSVIRQRRNLRAELEAELKGERNGYK